ncbi:hypothetical protein Nepgr_029466 [Nepenthes gracilis]|uniref:Uncharacterized protein n=1 Tax=Nepenthes gracilis TaxID=150966 RepID=A0AAD3TEB7_NEPGR|nr:hypothetical protein Nepgr_029466 [Nepenthes gracilis]
MALCRLSLITLAPRTPAKGPTTFKSLIVRTACFILHPRPQTHSLSSSIRSLQSTFPEPRSHRANPPQKNVYPDPIPEFAEAETQKFKVELTKKLMEEDRDTFGDELHTVVIACAKILNEFLCKEYGGPGTLLVEPFTCMLVTLKEKKLPGAPLAARASLLWAQNNVDRDWEVWTSRSPR